MKRLLTIIIPIIIACTLQATAENLENIPTQFINAEKGLTGETVSDIISDNTGQIWIATNNGVNHYNGIRMVNIPIPKKLKGKNYVYDICTGSGGSVFIATDKAEAEKYKGIKMDQQECKEIVRQMKKYLEQTKCYTDQDMKMRDLAEYLHISASRLSMVFNLYLHENYYEFINRYRLAEFKRLIAGNDTGRYTIIALSEKCGFKKSNFFSTFRKIEGMTPTEYLKKHNIVMQK